MVESPVPSILTRSFMMITERVRYVPARRVIVPPPAEFTAVMAEFRTAAVSVVFV